MGKYDDIRPEDLRADMVRFARLILRLEENDLLLRSVPELQRLIGDLRQKLFAYEVRGTQRLELPKGQDEREREVGSQEEPDPTLKESLRVVREAIEREKRLQDEWEGRPPPEDAEGDEEEDE